MAKRLTDQQVAEIRAQAAAGADFDALAAEFGCTERHIRRITSGEQRAAVPTVEGGPVASAVRTLVDGLALEDTDRPLAEAVVVLGVKLDSVAGSDSAASAQAAGGLVRELRESIRALRGQDEDVADALKRMLSPLIGGRS